MGHQQEHFPDPSAIGSASLRAMHLLYDQPPIFADDLGLRLASPDGKLHLPAGMTPESTRRIRASIVARARFIEARVAEQVSQGLCQYVILGAGLDTFAQRRLNDLGPDLRVFEVDKPGPQAWKQQRLIELGLGIAAGLRFVPVDFEAGTSWWDALLQAGFDVRQRAVVTSTGVSMYLSQQAVATTLGQSAQLAPGSLLLMSFALPPEQLEAQDRRPLTADASSPPPAGAPATVFSPEAMLTLAHDAGFRQVEIVSSTRLGQMYFADRADTLWPSSYQDLLMAKT